MRIKLALLDEDQNYLQRMASVFGAKYAGKIEIYSFANQDTALSAVRDSRIDVLIAGDSFDVDTTALPKKCGFAYFVPSTDIDTYRGKPAICKFQKADLIYKQILAIYSEVAGNAAGLKLDGDSAKLIAFTSPCGGVGTSSMAAACALYLAARGKKVLYLNLEKFGSPDLFFHGEGQFDMSEVIFALKSNKPNLSVKLESCVRKDPRGVSFYSQTRIALDMIELKPADILRLISVESRSGLYTHIIVDMDFGMDVETLSVLRQAHSVFWVGDGRENSNAKLRRAFEALSLWERQEDAPLTNRLRLLYNRFSNKSGKALEGEGIQVAGGAPRYERASAAQVVESLSGLGLFEKIL